MFRHRTKEHKSNTTVQLLIALTIIIKIYLELRLGLVLLCSST